MKIQLFGLGISSKSKAVTAKLLQNLYLETRPAGEKSQTVAYGTPGQELFVSFGDTRCRGWITFESADVFYVVHRGTLWEVNNSGTKTNRGSLLTTTGRCSLAHNGTQVMIVDGTYGYIYNTSTLAFAQITDVDFPSAPQTVTFQDGYFVVNKGLTGRFYISASYNGLAWDALDFASAESSPDQLIAVVADHGELMLFGTITTEFWSNTGAADFPYARIQGAASEWGLAARWSLAKYDNSVVGLLKNRMGQVMVAKMAGYVPQKISNVDMDNIINGYTSVSDAESFSYMLGGHPMYQINFPSEGYSWMYDGATGEWTSMKSYGITRHNAEMGLDYLNQTLVSDYSSGNIYRLNPDVYTDNGSSIERELISENTSAADLERIVVDRVRVDVESGVGIATGQGSDPQIMLQVSRDNGHTWGAEMWQSMGKIGEYGRRVEWWRLGQSPTFNFKLRITDPVKVVITNAMINPAD
jgi:hypothetical protein